VIKCIIRITGIIRVPIRVFIHKEPSCSTEYYHSTLNVKPKTYAVLREVDEHEEGVEMFITEELRLALGRRVAGIAIISL
jgi:hypothetical protein